MNEKDFVSRYLSDSKCIYVTIVDWKLSAKMLAKSGLMAKQTNSTKQESMCPTLFI